MLQFFDDTLLFCKSLFENILVIKKILRCFELVSSLKVNFLKNEIGGLGVDHTNMLRFSKILNYRTMFIPFIYLGMPIGGNHKRRALWKDMIEKKKTSQMERKTYFVCRKSHPDKICVICYTFLLSFGV